MFGTRIQTFSFIKRCRLTCADLDCNKLLGISVSVNADIALLKAISHVSLMIQFRTYFTFLLEGRGESHWSGE